MKLRVFPLLFRVSNTRRRFVSLTIGFDISQFNHKDRGPAALLALLELEEYLNVIQLSGHQLLCRSGIGCERVEPC